MKKILLLIITFFLTAQTIKAQTVVLDANGVTVKWTGTTVPTPYFVQASPRGSLEWFAIVDNTTKSNITDYAQGIPYFTPPSSSTPIPFNNIVTSLVTNTVNMFTGANSFNQPIDSWDVSNVTNMSYMFDGAYSFNQPIGSWDVSNVTNMQGMFYGASAFNQPIGNWDVSTVSNMSFMFSVSSFNQPVGNWDVSNVTDMSFMFSLANSFNQPIGNWDVSNVTNMSFMFRVALSFNQPIGSWNVSNVTDMESMFSNADSFNQPIGSWNVSNVISMLDMFSASNSFNQPIEYWNVSNVTDMFGMFRDAIAFNQPIGNWDVSNVTDMDIMFIGTQLSTPNYDATLIGWATIGPNETPLKPNVTFSGGNSNYCNGEAARSSIISIYGWTITDAGLNCELSTETFDATVLKLYPNPVFNILNVTVNSNFINQPYSIVDGLGRVVLNGNLNEVDTAINVEQLSKGIYYIKLSDSNASKFIKE
jgi:surface protein